eukprot:1887601-Amphidinium_carterae.1
MCGTRGGMDALQKAAKGDVQKTNDYEAGIEVTLQDPSCRYAMQHRCQGLCRYSLVCTATSRRMTFTELKSCVAIAVATVGPVSYTHLRAHETEADL